MKPRLTKTERKAYLNEFIKFPERMSIFLSNTKRSCLSKKQRKDFKELIKSRPNIVRVKILRMARIKPTYLGTAREDLLAKYYAKKTNWSLATYNNRSRRLASPGKLTAQQWESIKRKFAYTCLRCRQREPEIKLTIDHVIPISKGGSKNPENVQPLCKRCNSIKHAKTLDYRRKIYEPKRKLFR